MTDYSMPPDPTREELKIINFAHALIYSKIKDPKDKFIVAYHFDLGYTREDTAIALGCHYKTVWSRIEKIKKMLGDHYRPPKSKETPQILVESEL